MNYMLWIDEKASAPLAREAVLEMVELGTVTKGTLACECGDGIQSVWRPLGDVASVFQTEQESRPSPSPAPASIDARQPFWWLKWAGLICVLFVGVIWACGLFEIRWAWDAYHAAESHLLAKLPLGTTLSWPKRFDIVKGNHPWLDDGTGDVVCWVLVKEARDSKLYELTVHVARFGRWWRVVKVEGSYQTHPWEYMAIPQKEVGFKSGDTYSYGLNSNLVYSVEGLINSMAGYGWDLDPAQIQGQIVFRRKTGTGEPTRWGLQLNRHQ